MPKKLILLTNDDGIKANGITTLYKELKKFEDFDVKIVAPDRERSAAGHSITVFEPVLIKKEYIDNEFCGYSVKGTPADCVKIAIMAIFDHEPDLLISGINKGANIGENIIYSGTVSAATEGSIYGVSSMAVSIDNMGDTDCSFTAKFAGKVARTVINRGGLPKGTLLNINVPDIPSEKIKGVRITRQGNARFMDEFVKRVDPRGREYYWITGEFKDFEGESVEDDDYKAVKKDYISITPIQHDRTAYDKMKFFSDWDINKDVEE